MNRRSDHANHVGIPHSLFDPNTSCYVCRRLNAAEAQVAELLAALELAHYEHWQPRKPFNLPNCETCRVILAATKDTA